MKYMLLIYSDENAWSIPPKTTETPSYYRLSKILL
jgi:hypothetical protein